MKIIAEIYIAMNECGDYEVGISSEEASDRLIDNGGSEMIRIVKIAAKMTPPAIAETTIDVSDEAGETTEVEAA